MSESAVGVLCLAAWGLDDPVETHEVAENDPHHSCPFGCSVLLLCADRRDAGNSSALNTLQFSFGDLALVLPNRGVAMVYLAEEDD